MESRIPANTGHSDNVTRNSVNAESSNDVRSTDIKLPRERPKIPSVFTQIVRRTEQLEDFRGVWSSWQCHSNCDLDYYQTVLDSLQSAQGPYVVVLFRDGIPAALLIGRLEKTTVDLSVGYKRILGLPAQSLTFLHGGYLGDQCAENCAELLRTVVQSLADGEADLAHFNHLRTDQPFFQEIRRCFASSARSSLASLRIHRGMTMATSGNAFLQKLTSKERNNQKRRFKRLQEDFGGEAKVVCLRSTDDFEQMVRDVDAIARGTYQKGLGVAFEDTPALRQRLRMEAERGWLRTFILYLAGHPSAFWMGNVYADTFFSGFTGYDAKYARYAPGMFLLIKTLEQLCDENADGRLKKADFGLGDAEWKVIIGDLEWPEAPVSIFAPTVKGRLLSSIHFASGAIDYTAKKALNQARLLGRVKRVWRGRLSGASQLEDNRKTKGPSQS